jgi:hypothetical protein
MHSLKKSRTRMPFQKVRSPGWPCRKTTCFRQKKKFLATTLVVAFLKGNSYSRDYIILFIYSKYTRSLNMCSLNMWAHVKYVMTCAYLNARVSTHANVSYVYKYTWVNTYSCILASAVCLSNCPYVSVYLCVCMHVSMRIPIGISMGMCMSIRASVWICIYIYIYIT